MSTSELHSRLEHLVSYSSQLIFVSNDKINQQSKIVEAFLGHQAEDVEVAIIDAKQTTFLRDYRKQLFTQLVGASGTSDFELPLNQLLSSLNQYEGPILIIVSHADNLPQKFLQELWELVLQSRFAGNKQHLNVLLFTQLKWAEQAKTWLPSGGGNKPILLNSESILSTEGNAANHNGQTDLEELIRVKREQFAERIRDRESSYEPIQPVLHKPWLTSLMILLFISVFGGMLYWQYPEVTNNWLKHLGPTSDVPIDAATSELASEGAGSTIELTQITTEQTIQANTKVSDFEATQTPHEEMSPVAPYSLITDWKNVVKQIDNATTSRLTQSGADQLNKSPIVLDKALTAETLASQPQGHGVQTLVSHVELIPTPIADLPEINFKDEDIIALEALDVGLVKTTPVPPVKNIVEESLLTNNAEPINILGYSNDETTLLQLPENRYLIQVASMGNRVLMETYITQNQLQDQLWMYKTQRVGADWFVLLHNQPYSSLELAKKAVGLLPDALQQGPPFIKTSTQVSQEIKR